MSETLRFVSDDLQLMALSFMAIVYILRIRWLLRFKAGRERQAPTGRADTTPRQGDSSIPGRTSPALGHGEHPAECLSSTLQFVLFHLAVAANITMSFIIPYAPGLMKPGFVVRGLAGSVCRRLPDRVLPPVPPSERSGHPPDQHPGRFFFSPPADGLVVRLHLGGPEPSGSGGRAVDGLFHHDRLLSGLCAVQQNLPLSLLSFYPLLFRQDHGVPRSLSDQTRPPAETDQSLILEGYRIVEE